MFTPRRGERPRTAVDHVLGAQRPDRPLHDVQEPVEVDLRFQRREPLEPAQRHDDFVRPVHVAGEQPLQVVEMRGPCRPGGPLYQAPVQVGDEPCELLRVLAHAA